MDRRAPDACGWHRTSGGWTPGRPGRWSWWKAAAIFLAPHHEASVADHADHHPVGERDTLGQRPRLRERAWAAMTAQPGRSPLWVSGPPAPGSGGGRSGGPLPTALTPRAGGRPGKPTNAYNSQIDLPTARRLPVRGLYRGIHPGPDTGRRSADPALSATAKAHGPMWGSQTQTGACPTVVRRGGNLAEPAGDAPMTTDIRA
jgi:hypothetical protein